MYLIQASMQGQLSIIPTTLPPGLYEQAAGITTHVTGGSGTRSPRLSSAFPPAPPSRPLQQNYTGQSTGPRLPARPSTLATAASSLQSRALPWDVTAAEKANSDRYFDTLDTQKKDFIEGDVAVPFMLESKLDGEILAQVWCGRFSSLLNSINLRLTFLPGTWRTSTTTAGSRGTGLRWPCI
jgi:epidermal growth factor receptor substrate 15